MFTASASSMLHFCLDCLADQLASCVLHRGSTQWCPPRAGADMAPKSLEDDVPYCIRRHLAHAATQREDQANPSFDSSASVRVDAPTASASSEAAALRSRSRSRSRGVGIGTEGVAKARLLPNRRHREEGHSSRDALDAPRGPRPPDPVNHEGATGGTDWDAGSCNTKCSHGSSDSSEILRRTFLRDRAGTPG